MTITQKTIALTTLFFVSLSASILAVSQKVVFFCFIACFYFGISFYSLNLISFDISDIGFLILAVSFFSFFLVPSVKPPLIPASANSILIALYFFVAWCFVSMLINLPRHSSSVGWNSLWFLFNLLQLPLGFYIFSSRPVQRYREFILNSILVFSCLEIGIALFQHFLSYDTITGTFAIHHAMLGNMMVPAAVISFYKLSKTEVINRRIAYSLLFILSLYTILLSETRSILGGMAIALLVFLLRYLKLTLKHLLVVSASVLLLFIIVKTTPLGAIIDTTINSKDTPIALDLSSFGRLLIWKGSVDHFLYTSFPEKLIGCGPGKFSTVLFDFFVFNKKGSSGAHNNYLHALIETGSIGLILFVALFIIIIIALIRFSPKDLLAKIFLFGTISLLGSGFSQETFWVQPVFGNFWLFYIMILGLIAGYRSDKKMAIKDRSSPEVNNSNPKQVLFH